MLTNNDNKELFEICPIASINEGNLPISGSLFTEKTH